MSEDQDSRPHEGDGEGPDTTHEVPPSGQEDTEAGRAQAKRWREAVDRVKSKASKGKPRVPESPREFIQRRMEELESEGGDPAKGDSPP